MAKLSIFAGTTQNTINIFVQSASTSAAIGAGKTGLTSSSSGLSCYYSLPKAIPVAISLSNLTTATSAWSSGGMFELNAANNPGLYRLDLPDAACAAASGRFVDIFFQTSSTAVAIVPNVSEIELTGWNNQDGVHGGLSCLPNTAVSSNASLITSGTGTAQLSVTSGVASSNTTQWNGSAVASPATAGIPDVNVKNMNNVAATAITTIKAVQGLTTADTIATYTGDTPQTGDNYARLGAPAGASVSADIAAIKAQTNNIATSAAIATAIWQDATAGDFTVASSIGKSLYTTGALPGAAGGLFIAGTNAATAITTGLTAHIIGTVDTLTTYTGNTPQTGDAYARLGAPAGASVSADIAALPTVAGILTTSMTEAYAAVNGTLTIAKALYGITQQLGQMSITATTMTVLKRDGATTAKTYTLNDAVNPTSISEAS